MSGDAQFTGDIPGNYDRCLGPNIFEDYAADIARRALATAPSNVLELAAGTGIVSRKLRDMLPASIPLVATDLNGPMLDIARTKFRDDENVDFRVADAMDLPFPDRAFDLIVCQFGVMFFPDKPASFREALRVLKPGGTYLFNTWGSHDENPFSRAAHEVAIEMFPDNPPGFYKTPFSCAEPEPIIADLSVAGFRDVRHEAVALDKRVADIALFAHGLVHGNPMVEEVRARGGDPDGVARAIEVRLRAAFGPAQEMPLKANVFTARRP